MSTIVIGVDREQHTCIITRVFQRSMKSLLQIFRIDDLSTAGSHLKTMAVTKGLFDFILLKFNSYHINVLSNALSTKCTPIACMSVQIMSNLRDESIKPN
jgi:hypothetical protein